MQTELQTLEFEKIAQDNSYGFLIFKPDAVEKDLVESLLSHVLCSEPFARQSEVVDLCILEPITEPEDLRMIYPDLQGEIWEANLRLFASNYTVIAVLKGEGLNVWEELEKIKGKVQEKPECSGLKDGIRGLIPTVGEKAPFIELRMKKTKGIALTQDDYYRLARNLVHTPDTYEERLAILKLIQKYEQTGRCI